MATMTYHVALAFKRSEDGGDIVVCNPEAPAGRRTPADEEPKGRQYLCGDTRARQPASGALQRRQLYVDFHRRVVPRRVCDPSSAGGRARSNDIGARKRRKRRRSR